MPRLVPALPSWRPAGAAARAACAQAAAQKQVPGTPADIPQDHRGVLVVGALLLDGVPLVVRTAAALAKTSRQTLKNTGKALGKARG